MRAAPLGNGHVHSLCWSEFGYVKRFDQSAWPKITYSKNYIFTSKFFAYFVFMMNIFLYFVVGENRKIFHEQECEKTLIILLSIEVS